MKYWEKLQKGKKKGIFFTEKIITRMIYAQERERVVEISRNFLMFVFSIVIWKNISFFSSKLLRLPTMQTLNHQIHRLF